MISYFHLEMSNYKKRHIHFLSDFAYNALHPRSKIKGMPRLRVIHAYSCTVLGQVFNGQIINIKCTLLTSFTDNYFS